MGGISTETTLEELAALVSQALERAGVRATLSGGAAVSLYSENEYQSSDLDFVSSDDIKAIGDAIAPLGFTRVGKARQFEHERTHWYLEFPPGPVAFGDTFVRYEDIPVIETEHGPLRIVTPTQVIMDRVAAFVYWKDNPSWDQAAMVAGRQDVDWSALSAWAGEEGIDPALIERLRSRTE
jgi:hypothetical protein